MMKVTAFALAVGTAQGASHGADNCGTQSVTSGGVSYKKVWTKKATLTAQVCSSSAVTQATCRTGCCQVDATKCGAKDPSCATGKFWDMAKSQTARGADDTAAKTNCCTAQAKCSTMTTCPAGYVLDTTKNDNYCKGAACTATSDLGCCKVDTNKCRSKIGSVCGTGLFLDSTKYGNANGADWKATTACCSQAAKCTGYTCPAGQKLKAAHATTYCAGTACSTTSTADQGQCCEADTDKCGGDATITCDAGKFKDSSKAGTAKGADPKAACCTAQAKCAATVCTAGMKLKSNAASLYCAGAACSSKAGDTTKCCEADTTKCFGATVTCAATQFKDPTKYGVVAGTDAAGKITNCCTAKTTCAAFISADLSGTAKGSTSAAWQPKGHVMQVVVALATVLSVKQFWL